MDNVCAEEAIYITYCTLPRYNTDMQQLRRTVQVQYKQQICSPCWQWSWRRRGESRFKVQGWVSETNRSKRTSSPHCLCRSRRTTVFSRYPTMLQFIITGNVDIKCELVKFGEYMNRDSIQVQSQTETRA